MITSLEIPAVFVKNDGQLENPSVLFYSPWGSKVAVLSDGRILVGNITLRAGNGVKLVEGEYPSDFPFFYHKGNGSFKTMAFKGVVLRGVSEGINVHVVPVNDGHVEVQFEILPGASLQGASLEVEGGRFVLKGERLLIDSEGKETEVGSIRAFQGSREVPVKVKVEGKRLTFEVGEYSKGQTLIIDPVIAAIVSSSENDRSFSIALDSGDYFFIAGETYNYSNFSTSRVTFGSPDSSDAFVVKLRREIWVDTTLSDTLSDSVSVVATAIIGGSSRDWAVSVAVGEEGVYVAGNTSNYLDFAPSRTVMGSGGGVDPFVTLLSGDLSSHVATAIVSSNRDDNLRDMVIRSDGVYITGVTDGANTFAPSRNTVGSVGNTDVFVSHISSDLSDHVATLVADIRSTAESVGGMDISGSRIYVVGSFANNVSLLSLPPPFYMFDLYLMEAPTSLLTASFDTIQNPYMDFGLDVVVSPSAGPIALISVDDTTDFPHTSTYIYGSGNSGIYLYAWNSRTLANLSYAGDLMVSGGKLFLYEGGNRIYVIGNVLDPITAPLPRSVHGLQDSTDVFISAFSLDLSTHVRTFIYASRGNDYGTDLKVAPPCASSSEPRIFSTGYTTDPSTFVDGRFRYGTPGKFEAFATAEPCPLGSSGDLSVSEVFPGDAVVVGKELRITLRAPAYVGYDTYSLAGRLLRSESLGYLPSGRYTFSIEGNGPTILKLRIGDRIRILKLWR